MTGQVTATTKSQPQQPLTARMSLYASAASTVALAFGILLPVAPQSAIAWLITILLVISAPVWRLSAIVAITVLVPFGLQDAFSVIGGHGRPSVLVVDVLLVSGVLGIGWRVVRGRLNVDLPLLAGIMMAAACAAALALGIAHGANVSEAGNEARRVMLGLGAFVIAWPLINDETARRQLTRVLLAIGLVLGLWGLAQWMFSVDYTAARDAGVRDNGVLSLRQLQGGMFAYPIAAVLAWAVLLSGRVRNVPVKWLLIAILLLNAVCIVLTFERTTWLVTGIACLFAAAMSGPHARVRAFKWTGMAVAVVVAVAVIKPGPIGILVERLTSVGQLGSDNSFRWRIVESQAAADAIAAHPITGSGFGATITWELKDVFPIMTTPFIHNGYIWLAWKIGLPVAALVAVVLVRAVLRRCPTEDSAQWRSIRQGSQASVLALLITCITFSAFNSLGITAATGLLVAICYSRSVPAVSRAVGLSTDTVFQCAEGRDDGG